MWYNKPLFKTRKTTAVEVGYDFVKIVEIETRKNKINTPMCLKVSMPPVENFTEYGETVAESIAGAFRSSGASKNMIVSVMPGDMVFTKILNMPRMSRAELARTLQWESGRYFPDASEGIIIRYIVLEELIQRGRPFFRVLMVILRENQARAYHGLFSRAGLTLRILDLPGLALMEAVTGTGHFTSPDKGLSAFINIGINTIHLVMVKDESLKYCRTISTGLNKLDSSLMTEEIKKTINYYLSTDSREPLKELYMCGDFPDQPNVISRLLARENQCPVTIVQPFFKIDPSYTMAIGMALRGARL